MATRHPRLAPSQAFETALSFHGQGRLREAEGLYRDLLKVVPEHPEALHYLGVLKAQQGKHNEAIRLIRRSIEKQPGSAEAHNDLGVALESAKRPAEAVAAYERALALRPDYPDASFNLGNALQALEQHEKAIEHFAAAIARKSDHAEAHHTLGLSLSALSRFEAAITHFEQALAQRPRYAAAHYNLGNALKALGRDDEAIAQFEATLAIKPDYFEALNNLGAVLVAQERYAEALEHYQKASAIKPEHAGIHFHIGRVLTSLNRRDEAARAFERAVALRPDYIDAYYSLGALLWERGLREQAMSRWRKVLALNPDHVDARISLCLGELPIIYASDAEIAEQRNSYERALRQICAEAENGAVGADVMAALAAHLPFHLPYQGFNDRELQTLWGGLVRKVVAAHYPDPSTPPRAAPDGRIRIGIISGFFYRHTVWKLMIQGWLTQLDRRKFAVFGYHTKREQDTGTELAVELCERLVRGPLSTDRWREEILADQPHVLIYPEIGMEAASVLLAAQRLAPVQCVSWGHPETTGIPTLDYFLTSDLMEPPDGQTHYTEKLVRLPNLSIYYEPPPLEPVSMGREQVGLRKSAVAFWCGQSVFKYLPRYDDIYPRIAREVGDCQFVFIRYHRGVDITKRFRDRLDAAFKRFGLKAAEHCVFLDRLSPSEFVAAVGQCDIYLDSIGWSGGNTTLESLQHALPIVTMWGSLMRGRHSAAILEQIGVTETIGRSVDEYVAIAVRLGRDPAWRTEVRERMSRQKHRAYRDRSPIEALENFLEDAVRGRIRPATGRR